MKKLSLLFAFLSLFSAQKVLFAQAYQNSWGFGFGLSYPRFLSSDVSPMNYNVGGLLSLQRNFSQNVALRLLGNYDYIEGKIPGGSFYYNNGGVVQTGIENMHTNIASGNLDLLYYFVPCFAVDPYFGGGFGVAYFKPVWPKNIQNSQIKSKFTAQFNAVFGSEWKVSENWKLNTEFGMHSIDGEVDGIVTNNRQGIFGSNADCYITFNAGFIYYFDKGAKSKYCDLYNGITVEVPKENYPTLEQIDSLITAHIPKEVVKEVVVEKPVEKQVEKLVEKPVVEKRKSWILHGVNFKSNSSELLPESYPVLEQEKQNLKENPDIRVEIQGYTDNVGKDTKNKKLSEKRANTVREYLINGGIDPSRLNALGFGKSNPIGDNNTEKGRAENRRIEFKIIN